MNMTREEAIKSLKNIVEYWTYKPTEVEAAKMAIAALRPVSREQVERMRGEWRSIHGLSEYYCSCCGEEFEIHSYDKEKYRFCPYCSSPMTDEAMEIAMERINKMEEITDEH